MEQILFLLRAPKIEKSFYELWAAAHGGGSLKIATNTKANLGCKGKNLQNNVLISGTNIVLITNYVHVITPGYEYLFVEMSKYFI